MERFVIRIHPAPTDDSKLRVTDAMQQVLDALLIFDDAQQSLGTPHEAFEWRLEQATTNSPFTVTAIAEPLNPAVDVSQHVKRVKAEVSHGMRRLIARGDRPHWMSARTMSTARQIFARTLNGIGATDIDFDVDGGVISIDPPMARAGMDAIAAINVLDVAASLPERQAYGEIEGQMPAAGRYRSAPALQIRTELYGYIWCTLSKELIARFGGQNKLRDVWTAKL